MEINLNITLTNKQREAYDLIHQPATQVLVARWSRQCGKTIFAEVMMLEYLLKKNTINAYISPTYSQGRKVYKEIVELLQQTSYLKKANSSALIIETTLGSTLHFFTMENATAIRGYTISGILVLDEAAFFKAQLPDGTEPWSNVILPITKARKPKILVISTPNGKQGLFYDLYLKALNGDKGYRQLTATIHDDELISEEEIAEIKNTISPMAFRQEFEVEFLDSALTVFPDFEKCFTIAKYQGGKCWCGIDPSSVGSDNTIVTFVNSKNEVKQYKVEGELDEKYSKIAQLINQQKPEYTYCESNSIGEVMANEIRKKLDNKRFTTWSTTNETKREQVGMLATLIANRNIAFEQDNTLLFNELSTFTYQITKTGKTTFAARQGYHDDTVMSLCIALQCKEDRKTNSTVAFLASNNKIFR